jgi:hypothetical protein
VTDESWRVLKHLHAAGQHGRIQAKRIFPHPHHFTLYRQPPLTEQHVALATVDHLVRAGYIEPEAHGVSLQLAQPVHLDRFDYRITNAGRQAAERRAEERKRRRPQRESAE